MKNPSIHIALPADLKTTLKEFSATRVKSMTAIIVYALEKLFENESTDPTKHAALKAVIERKLSIPKPFTPESFFVALYMNASHAPDSSARDWWGVAVYLSGIEKTNKEIFTEIQDELKRAVRA